MFLTPLFAFLLTRDPIWYKYLSLSVFVLASITDWCDGYFARKQGNITKMGKYLDPLADKLMISGAFAVFTWLGYVKVWMFAAIALRDFLITALRSYALFLDKPFETSSLAKWKTFFQMFAIYCLFIWLIIKETYKGQDPAPVFIEDVEYWNLLEYLMLFVTVLTLATGVSYLYENRRHLKSLAIAFYRVFVPTNIR
jgi:CDP-diacylglycerol--glycerol-3-phosphate 3-phosphatidyltransferase